MLNPKMKYINIKIAIQLVQYFSYAVYNITRTNTSIQYKV